MTAQSTLKLRRLYLVVGVFAMLFSGILYAWSILKIPFKEVFLWSDAALALNFTLTMCFFCLGAFGGSILCKKLQANKKYDTKIHFFQSYYRFSLYFNILFFR